MNRAEEDYMKVIYELTVQAKQPIVKTNELSVHFGYTDQSVNEMIKKLESKKLVSFIPYHGVSLTKKGQIEAVRMLRAHRLWEVFLTEKLGFAWEDVHVDAERLEHNSTEMLLNRLDDFLEHPKFCQHGNPIPNRDGYISSFSTLSLAEIDEGEQFQITRVVDDKELLVFLNENQLQLNEIIDVVKLDMFNGLMHIKKRQQTIILSFKTAHMIFGQRMP